ncbi:MAG: hypothetical protein NWQ46_06465 [Spirosomaceae bacterium]|nr:hypothetical protein [Spirosomataceae bacterium]
MKTTRKILLCQVWLLFLPVVAFAQTPAEYMLADANDYFKTGRYWDAFFEYRNVAKTSEFADNYEVSSQIKNSSKALYLKRKFENYRAFRQYELAKANLKELVIINPEDPNRGEIPRLTLKQAEDLMRLANRQRTDAQTAAMFQKSIKLYHLAMAEGLKDESVKTAIRMAELALKNTGVEPVSEPSTTYGIAETQKIEREREVKIIKEQ